VDTVHECDRQTDRRTDRITITKTVQRGSVTYERGKSVNNLPTDFTCRPTTVVIVAHTISKLRHHNIRKSLQEHESGMAGQRII